MANKKKKKLTRVQQEYQELAKNSARQTPFEKLHTSIYCWRSDLLARPVHSGNVCPFSWL